MEKENTILESVSDRIALMTIYRDEWKYRDQTFSMYLWRFVSLSLIITFLPNFLETVGTHLPLVNVFSPWLFPLLGIVCSVLGLCLGLAEIKRIRSIDNAYKSLANVFLTNERPEVYKYPVSLNKVLCCLLYTITGLLALINLYFLTR